MGTAPPKTKAKAVRSEGPVAAARFDHGRPPALAGDKDRAEAQRRYGNAEVSRVATLSDEPAAGPDALRQAGIVGSKPNPYESRESKGTLPGTKPNPYVKGGGGSGTTTRPKPNPYGKANDKGTTGQPKPNPYGKADGRDKSGTSKPNPYERRDTKGTIDRTKPNPYRTDDAKDKPGTSKPNPYQQAANAKADASKPNPYLKGDDKGTDPSKPNPYRKGDEKGRTDKEKPGPHEKGDDKEKSDKSKPNPYENGGKGTVEKSKPNPYEKGDGKAKDGKKDGKQEAGAGAGGPDATAASDEAGAGGKQEGEGRGGAEGGAADEQEKEKGGEAVMAEALPAPERPRLEGTEAAVLVMPPLAPQQLERIHIQTGLTAAEHYARVQVHLDRLSDRARSEQFAIVVHIELLEAEVRRDLENAAALIQPTVRSSIEAVSDACASARAGINGAAKEATQTIEKDATEADRKVDTAALTSKEAVQKAIDATSPALRALHEETMAPLRQLLAETAKKYQETGRDQAKAMVAEGAAIQKRLGDQAGDPIRKAQNEKRGEAAVKQANDAQADLVKAGEAGATAVLGMETTFSLSYLKLVNPVAVKSEEVAQAGTKQTTEKGGEVRLRLATNYERAIGFVQETQKRALASLDALEKSATRQLELMGRNLEEMARARRERLCNSLLEGQAPAAEAWAQQMAQVNELVPPGQLVDARRLEPRLVAALDSMNALSARQRLDLDAQARSRFDETRAALDEDRASLDQTAESFVGSARDTRRQATGMRQMAARFSAGFHGVAQPAATLIDASREKTEETLGLSVEDTRKQMKTLLANSKKSMKESLDGFKKKLGEVIKGLEKNLEPTFQQTDVDVIEDLKDRASRAYKAMDKVGTDETGLFESLYGMSPVYGAGLVEFWNREKHKHDLWWWLDDELSGDEYWTAYYYLRGDPVTAIQYQLKASIHWYGDDVAQMESGLRALTPDQMKELRRDKDFPEVQKTLLKNLKGTNLEVVSALIAGRTARADALRLKEQIDAARARGDDDKVHDLLSNIDPKRLPEIRREFADIMAGHKMGAELAPDKAKDDQALADFKRYITQPVKVYEPGPRGEVHERIRTMSEPSKRLAEALGEQGEGSKEARAARLVYETSRGGKPRPEKLAKALDDPDLVAARRAANDPKLKGPDADPQAVAAAKENLDRLEARRNEMLQHFTALKATDKATKEAAAKDPKVAQKFTEDAVAGLFGDDKLGRDLGSSMVSDGRAKPAVAIKYAVRGWGTNEELIRKTLRGMSKAEIAELKTDYAERFGKDSEGKVDQNKLYDDLGVFQKKGTAEAAGVSHATGGGFFTELSGDERQEVERLLLGKPENDRDRYRLAQLDYQHQRGEGTTWVSDAFSGATSGLAGMGSGAGVGQALDANKAELDQMVTAAGGEEKAFDKDGNFKDPRGLIGSNDFRVRTAATSGMAENYKNHMDSLADMITGAIAIIGAIVGTIVVTVLTLGTATPLVIGLWAAGIAAATGAAAMATNYALKGSRYGWEQAAVDGALTLLDAATAGLMAGAGAKAARAAAQLAAIKAAARTPAQMAATKGFVATAESAGRKEVARGFVRAAKAAGIGGAARTATADGTWDDGILTGLGRTASGGVKAAIVGVATHGASTRFGASKLARRLELSGFLGRGTGTGLGGAFGGFAGRATELGLDVLGGHDVGPAHEALLSIAAAGGRGFAENFGEGVAKGNKARRDAHRENVEEARRQIDNERVARTGMTQADVEGDLRFRRMAVAAAKHDDPHLDTRAFLKNLDAAVASDRAAVETNRQLARSFRREALAGIPPARRGEFADVPIHIVSDADFERFTGSQSGRAVTVVRDGEAQIVVRRSATPDTLREEGIHVLQSRDPKWRERIGLLDEKTLSRWDQLDLETQLALYRNKLDIELDAQERLRRNLLDEADRATDPRQRASLRARAKAAEDTHANLRARLAEVDSIGPERIDAIRRGREAKPQYLREPARLFTKGPKAEPQPEIPDDLKPKKTKDNQELRHGSPDLPNKPRRPVKLENSTWEDEYAGHRLFQVGDAWTEPSKIATGPPERWYRMVEVVDEHGNVVDRRREIRQERPGGRWQQRGSESSARGLLFEEASRQFTLAETRKALGRAIQPNRDPVVPIGALMRSSTGKRLDAQHGGGAGFDDVVFHFSRGKGGKLVAKIVIIEAKGHRRSLTLEDFSAITTNLPDNLAKLSAAVADSNLSDRRIRAVQEAIAARRLEFEVHTYPHDTTGLGDVASRRASILRTIRDTEEARRQLDVAQKHLAGIDPDVLRPRDRRTYEQSAAELRAHARQLEDAYRVEPFDPDRVHAAVRAILSGGGRPPSVRAIAQRHELEIVRGQPPIRRQALDTEGEHAPHLAKAREVRDEERAAGRPAGLALGLAQRINLAQPSFEPVGTAAEVPKDVVLVANERRTRSVAVTRPPVVASEAGTESAASEQLVDLLRDGVRPDKGRTVQPDHVLWDTAGTQAADIRQVLDQVRRGLGSRPVDAARLRVMVEGSVASTEAELRRALKLPAGVHVEEVIRPPHEGRTWVLSFDKDWTSAPKGRRR